MANTTAPSAVVPPGKRPYSIAVFGCSGNAGRAVAYQAIKSSFLHNNNKGTIALSGRNRTKVEKVLESLRDELRNEGIASVDDAKVGIIIADASDEESMLALAKSTSILISCAGPYRRYGEAAVKACVEGGSHYLDITGEVDFIECMISIYGKKAEEAGVTLCPFSGYDCLPAELALWLVGKALEGEGNDAESKKLSDLAMNFEMRGREGYPRGTIETMLDVAEGKGSPPCKDGTKFYLDRYRGTVKRALSPSHWLVPKYQLGRFTAPNIMSKVNVPVLCRAAPDFGFTSTDFNISDKNVVPGKPSLSNGYGLIPSLMYIATLVLMQITMAVPKSRNYLRNKISTYSYKGNPAGEVLLDAKGSSCNEKTIAIAKCRFPGDAGIYATGLYAVAVANALLEAISSGSKDPMPIAGFHTAFVALQGCRKGLLVEHLKELGAEIKVQIVSEGEVSKDVDPTKL